MALGVAGVVGLGFGSLGFCTILGFRNLGINFLVLPSPQDSRKVVLGVTPKIDTRPCAMQLPSP